MSINFDIGIKKSHKEIFLLKFVICEILKILDSKDKIKPKLS